MENVGKIKKRKRYEERSGVFSIELIPILTWKM
jgi:hypothetical protein